MNRGFSLLELVLSIAIFAVGAIVAGNLIIDSNTATRADLEFVEASVVARDTLEAVATIRDNDFCGLVGQSGSKGLSLATNATDGSKYWTLSGTSNQINGKFTRSVTLTTTPLLAPFTSTSFATATATVTWIDARGESKTYDLVTIFTNWRMEAGSSTSCL